MTANTVLAEWWHPAYIAMAREAFPAVTKGHDLSVGWKITHVDGTTGRDRDEPYYWGFVHADHDRPVLHEALAWDKSNRGSCPNREGDGFCLVTSSVPDASSGGISLSAAAGHVLVFPADLAVSNQEGKHRTPWVVQVDVFDPIYLIRLGFMADLGDVDLRGAHLRHANLWGADLRDADLGGADLRGADLGDADLRGAHASTATIWPTTGFDPIAAGVIVR